MDIFWGINNISFLDINTLLHFFTALILGFFVLKIFKKNYFLIGLSIIIVWEVFEALLRIIKVYYSDLMLELDFLPLGWSFNETFLNILGDLLVGFIGLGMMYFLMKNYQKD